MKDTMKCFNCGKEILILKEDEKGLRVINGFLDNHTLGVMCPSCKAVMGVEEHKEDDDGLPF